MKEGDATPPEKSPEAMRDLFKKRFEALKECNSTLPEKKSEVMDDLFKKGLTQLERLDLNKSETEIEQIRNLNLLEALMEEYQAEINKKPIYGLKITSQFKKFLNNNPSLNGAEKEEILEFCNSYEQQLPKIKLQEMQNIAQAYGGKCLSTEYIKNASKLKWQCALGHEWEAIPDNIQLGTWCPECARKEWGFRSQLTIEEMHDIAERRGGKCLSNEYKNNSTKLKWQCAAGHEWEATPVNVKMGTWCPGCAQNVPLSIKEMQELAENHGGKCLSPDYINNLTKLKWRCEYGHEWEASPRDIKTGTWCPECAHNLPLTIEEMQEIAEQRGGKCLSTEYINSLTKSLWQCAAGHKWEANPGNIKRGQWCPECSDGISERICRKIFETIFKKEFPKACPEWLINERGNLLELDGYNPELRIAFEYQGRQHFEYDPHFYTSEEEFEQRKTVDQLKRELCEKNGITLFDIPCTVKYEQMQDYFFNKCKEKGINVSNHCEKVDYRKLKIYTSKSIQKLNEMQEIARINGGECLSTEYINKHVRLKWKCKEGHKWESAPANIKGGRWCPKCAHNLPLTIEEMKEIAEQKGGECLSKEYLNNETKLLWQCVNGHIWEASPHHIKSNHWCPLYARENRIFSKNKKKD